MINTIVWPALPSSSKISRILAELSLRQVLRNLVGNALSHATGAVRVEAAREGPEVVVTVSDDGLGVAPEHQERIFERFYRVDPSRARTSGGAGLGLAIVKRLVEADGGSVGVTSRPGHGSRFWFRLSAAETGATT